MFKIIFRLGSDFLLNSVEGIRRDRPTFISQDKFDRIVTHMFRKLSDVEITAILHEVSFD